MWTEAWTGWLTEFGGPMYQRPVEYLAFAVARFIQKGGSFVNYYMVRIAQTVILFLLRILFQVHGSYNEACLQYHGGTNFGRTGAGPFITTSYAPVDEYGTPSVIFSGLNHWDLVGSIVMH
ncbi:hypothetical protein SAY86_020404 [Trapa natans]|uniref:beta-galactosidase n=1 Tax=Trapa natans TaxID=22666 RepID=A0AAN7M259_TRANT|nr:hypothetical protein SAY86_020404 [Trapa natans]